jgi:uncharacterized membrane protein YgcG
VQGLITNFMQQMQQQMRTQQQQNDRQFQQVLQMVTNMQQAHHVTASTTAAPQPFTALAANPAAGPVSEQKTTIKALLANPVVGFSVLDMATWPDLDDAGTAAVVDAAKDLFKVSAAEPCTMLSLHGTFKTLVLQLQVNGVEALTTESIMQLLHAMLREHARCCGVDPQEAINAVFHRNTTTNPLQPGYTLDQYAMAQIKKLREGAAKKGGRGYGGGRGTSRGTGRGSGRGRLNGGRGASQ